jgi:DNA repair exonuclease SbcCD nuclease subunit
MKIAIVTDMHIGVRGDSKIFLDHQERFFSKVFFPYLDENNIDIVFDLGDTFDRRKYINYHSLKQGREFFFDELAKRNIKYHALVGNHTTYYTNTNEINSMDLLLREYPNFKIYEHEAEELVLGSTKFLMVPWITKENYESILEKISNTDASVLMGHLEVKGFEMLKGTICTHGLDMSVFNSFENVYSGHFHHPSKYSNIEYLGAPYEMTWSDYQGRRGFHVFDTETKDLTRIQNPYRIFHKIDYDDSDLTIDEITNLETHMLQDTYIKVIVKNRTNAYLYDLFMNKLAEAGAADIKSIDDSMNLESVGAEEIMDETKDTKEILHNYIDSLETNVNKNKVKSLVDELYIEAMNLG